MCVFVCVCVWCRVAVETLWNILPELKVVPDEELETRVGHAILYSNNSVVVHFDCSSGLYVCYFTVFVKKVCVGG